jgi:hypothetical protein
MIQIAVINESTAMSDADVQKMIPAFQTQWSRDLAPVWDLEDAVFTWNAKTNPPPASSWWVVFLDDSDQAGALAYHDVTDTGLPLAKVFAKTILQDKSSVSVGATHEICEMAVDPTINLAAQDNSGTFWAYEVCDPVEDDQYGYDINGVLVSDFVTPAWFGFKNATGAVDFQQHANAAFQVLEGGYAQQFKIGSQGWQQINGSKIESKGKKRALKAPDGSRRQRRVKLSKDYSLAKDDKHISEGFLARMQKRRAK